MGQDYLFLVSRGINANFVVEQGQYWGTGYIRKSTLGNRRTSQII